jgi:hypothetical protein
MAVEESQTTSRAQEKHTSLGGYGSTTVRSNSRTAEENGKRGAVRSACTTFFGTSCSHCF